MAYVTLVDRDKRKESVSQLVRRYRKDLKHMIKGMEVVVQDLSLRGFAASRGFPVEFIIQGAELGQADGFDEADHGQDEGKQLRHGREHRHPAEYAGSAGHSEP